MLIRLVKMQFEPEKLPLFLAHFEAHKQKIRQQPGCLYLRVLQAPDEPGCIFTYSYWASETDLNNYRQSAFFAEVWAYTKTLFAAKPQAWTLTSLHELI